MKNDSLFISDPAEQPQNIGHQQHFPERGVISVGELTLDQSRHLCIWRQNCIDLTKTEFALLASLSRHPGYVKSRDQLIDEICGTNVNLMDRSIDSYVKRLRKKLKAIDPGFREIQTVHGIGYRYRIQMADLHRH